MIRQALGMSSSPLSSVLSPAQVAIVQQARALVAKPQAAAFAEVLNGTQGPAPAKTQAAATGQPVPRGRGQIVNITV